MNQGQTQDDFVNRVNRIQLDRKNLKKDHPQLKNESWDIIYDQVCYDSFEARGACEAFRGKTPRYIFTSSQSVYEAGAEIGEETFNPHSYSFQSPAQREVDYGEAKRQAESTFFQAESFSVTAVRFPIVLGEDDYTDRLKFHIQKVAEQKPIFFPNHEAKISFIYSADAAAFLATLIHKEISGPINCCAQEPIALKDLISTVETVVRKKGIISHSAEVGFPSPYGIESDWYMSTKKLKNYGFHPAEIGTWISDLIGRLS